MGRVPVAVVHVVGVILVRHGDMTAAGTMLMRVPLMDPVPRVAALVDVVVVKAVQVAVVDVVCVIPMGHGDMTAALPVGVRVLGVHAVDGGRHGATSRLLLDRPDTQSVIMGEIYLFLAPLVRFALIAHPSDRDLSVRPIAP
jgi:hypothetical protein